MRYLLTLAFGLQPIVGQLCGIQSSCNSCLSVAGCVWNANACWSSSSYPFCANDANCYAIKARCPVIAAPVVYPQPITTSFYAGTTLPPVYTSTSVGTVLPPVATSIAYPVATTTTYPVVTTLPATTLPTTYPVVTTLPATTLPTTTYPLPTTTFPIPTTYPVATSIATSYPVASASLYARPSVVPTVVSTPLYTPSILPSASFSTYGSVLPAATASFSTPIYSGVSAPVYTAPAVSFAASAYPTYGTQAYAGGRVNTNVGLFGNGQLFNYQGNPIEANIRNNFYAEALAPVLPGISGAVSTANNLNLITNTPRIVDNVIGGQGYRRDPLGAYVRNDLYANALGDLVPGLGGTLSTFNQLNLYSSLLG